MSLPVSQYEALLAEVRGLRRKVQRVQQLADPLISEVRSTNSLPTFQINRQILQNDGVGDSYPLDYTMESLLLERQNNVASDSASNYGGANSSSVEGDTTGSEDEYRCGGHRGTHMSVSSEPISSRDRGISSLYHGTWPVEKNMWNSEPISLGPSDQPCHSNNLQDVNSVMSFASSAGGVPLDRVLGSPDRSRRSSQQLEAKVDMVYSLLAMLGSQEHADMGETLLALSTNPESCLAMRQSGCIPLLVQLVQSDRDLDTRRKASQALHNLVHSQPDEKIRKREVRIFKLLEHTRAYTEALRNNLEFKPDIAASSEEDSDQHPVQTVAHLMKLSFDEGHRQAICQLGGIHTIASLVEAEHANHSSTTNEPQCILLRRYACMALTNLTFGDSGNKALLCSYREFMRALVVQLQSPSDELRQVTASVLRNLSWRADSTSKEILREVGSVSGLMKAAMMDNKENTLKSILSALWNLSAHCTENKSEICAVEGALGFLVHMLTYKTPTKSLAIIENSGGILRNISSQIAVRDDYREQLRKHNCLQILLDQLKSPSLTIVSNACGTLWNLSAKCTVDQESLCKMGAPAMLRSLNYSKHKMIAMGSTAALKNLLSAKPAQSLGPLLDPTSVSLDLPALPTLGARKQKALLQDLDQNLSETYENIEKESPVKQTSHSNDFIQKPSKYGKKTEHREYARAKKQDDLANTFSSLTLNEPSTSYSSDVRTSSKLANYGSTSLPYMNISQKRSSTPSSYIPVRNKYSDCSYEDEAEPTEGPIDYSQKYLENTIPNNITKCVSPSSVTNDNSYMYNDSKSNTPSATNENNYVYNGSESDEKNYSIYTETDLDQPTDYSLRYAEDDSDSEICSKLQQDTVKTYCTEDTPYETPFNFSSATSLSDLRIDDKQVIDNDKLIEDKPTVKELSADLDEKDHCSAEDISDTDTRQKCDDKIKFKSGYSSGLMSPEKPVNYCEEGTPGYFSRVSSFSSLNSMPVNESKNESPKDLCTQECESSDSKVKTVQKAVAEAKAVKFEQTVNYAEETPLMFSRSSSLGSLGSMEQNPYHDDGSSVISDFSRLTSGLISPSELPDSPFQTVPQSPKPRTNPPDFPSPKPSVSSTPRQSTSKSLPKASIFEDNVTKFKEENTPVHFSTATSLSNLTIDDETSPPVNQVSEDEGDEDILAACINSGMQNNRYCQKNTPTPSSSSKLPVSKAKLQQKTVGQSTNVPLPHTIQGTVLQTNNTVNKTQDNADTVTTYCTEDTPALLSHAGSNSDLSVLSMPESDAKVPKKEYPSDESNLSEDEKLLAQCIASAMPKPKKESSSVASTSRCAFSPCVLPTTSSQSKRNPRSQLKEASKVHDKVVENENPILAKRVGAQGSTDQLHGSVRNVDPCKSRGLVDNHRNKSSKNYKGFDKPARQSPENLSNSSTTEQSHIGKPELAHPDSYSSLESAEISDADLALLEQCISLGMQKSKENAQKSVEVSEADQWLLEQCISSAMPKPKPTTESRSIDSASKCSSRTTEKENNEKPKNANVASATENILQTSSHVCPETTTTVVGVEESPKIEVLSILQSQISGTPPGTSQDKCLHSGENSYIDLTKSGSNRSLSKISDGPLEKINYSYSISDNCTDFISKDDIAVCLSHSCEESGQIVDNRMLDPDAMIESLDRFTAELVSQASHLKEDKFKSSVTDSTWNEDTSPNELTFPSISGSAPNVITFPSETDESSNGNKLPIDETDGLVEPDNTSNEVAGLNEPEYSKDFSSINTSTMTESTLIAIEATKMATVFQNEAAMSVSITSAASLELDQVQPPSQLNSMATSLVGFGKENLLKSPKLISRKKSLPMGLMVRRALSNSLNHSLESLENNSVSNLDHMNPPSVFGDVLDMENSMCSITSLPSENAEIKTDFQINGVISKESNPSVQHNPIFNVKQPANMLHLLGNSNFNSLNDLDNVNPPSFLNEITNMCSSLADVATENMYSATEVFEDCYTHVPDTIKTEDEITEFSDANSITPIQSDLGSSSNESTPKRTRSISKQLTSKQKRALAKERYKTYTVAAEMVMKEEITKAAEDLTDPDSVTEDYKTVDTSLKATESVSDTTYVSPTYSIKGTESIGETTYVSPTYSIKDSGSGKLTPRERRQSDRSRFQTQVLDVSIMNALKQQLNDSNEGNQSGGSTCNVSPSGSPMQSPAKSRLSIRRNFVQKRLENKDRFKTQTIEGSSFSPDLSSASPPSFQGEADMHIHLQKEANLVLKTLRETKTRDELLDCETLSLVSNDDDSENNSGCSINYRTYHKSWSVKKNVTDVTCTAPEVKQSSESNSSRNSLKENDVQKIVDDYSDHDSEEDEHKISGKPKIVKPEEKLDVNDDLQNEEAVKAIRGRRKPLYSKTNTTNKITPPKTNRPIRTLTSNLVKNVTSTLKSGAALKAVVTRQNKNVTAKPPVPQSKASSGYGIKPPSNTASPKTSPARTVSAKPSPKRSNSNVSKTSTSSTGTPPLERQGTFTKDEPKQVKSKIPSMISKIPTSKVPKPVATATKIPSKPAFTANTSKISPRGIPVKSASSDRANKNTRVYNRSTSADSRESTVGRKIQNSLSSQSLKNESAKLSNGTSKKPVSNAAARSNSNTSLSSTGSSSAKKQVTSKIASLWKKIEESKNKAPKNDTRVWIQSSQPEEAPKLIRSNTFDNKDGVTMRSRNPQDGEAPKRLSRLGSFIIMDEMDDTMRVQVVDAGASS